MSLLLTLIYSAWFFFKIMNVSGAEAVVAAASPWIGQGESACLVRPYVDIMTESELHLTMTSGTYLLDCLLCRMLIHIVSPRFLHNCRLCASGVHQSRCARTESCYLLRDVHPREYCNQQNACPRGRRTRYAWTCCC